MGRRNANPLKYDVERDFFQDAMGRFVKALIEPRLH
jgi:hypothetical protein